MERISTASTEYLYVPVSATVAGVPRDPTVATVEVALTDADLTPVEDDWRSASWVGGPPDSEARCLIGPDGTGAVTAGVKRPWVRISSTPEVIVKPCPFLLDFV